MFVVFVFLAAAVGYTYYKYRIANRIRAPANVVLLYQVGRGPRAPSFSPFPLKLETFLRMMKIPYMNDHSGRFSSKGKTPWIEFNGQAIADSQLSIEYLKQLLNIDPDSHLTKEERGVARAFLKLTEENLYWAMCMDMFGDNLDAVKTVIPYRGLKLWVTVTLLKRVIAKETWGHGIGRHTPQEVYGIATKDLDALSHFLGRKNFLMGDKPSEVDCAIFGMLSMIYWHMPGSKLNLYIIENGKNLVRYVERMKSTFWPDWDSRTLEGASYQPDAGKLYFEEELADNNNARTRETTALTS